jgi:hypothetical protein
MQVDEVALRIAKSLQPFSSERCSLQRTRGSCLSLAATVPSSAKRRLATTSFCRTD